MAQHIENKLYDEVLSTVTTFFKFCFSLVQVYILLYYKLAKSDVVKG